MRIFAFDLSLDLPGPLATLEISDRAVHLSYCGQDGKLIYDRPIKRLKLVISAPGTEAVITIGEGEETEIDVEIHPDHATVLVGDHAWTIGMVRI